jgi:hypothetical protein
MAFLLTSIVAEREIGCRHGLFAPGHLGLIAGGTTSTVRSDQ